jgi:hypothetical protein
MDYIVLKEKRIISAFCVILLAFSIILIPSSTHLSDFSRAYGQQTSSNPIATSKNNSTSIIPSSAGIKIMVHKKGTADLMGKPKIQIARPLLRLNNSTGPIVVNLEESKGEKKLENLTQLSRSHSMQTSKNNTLLRSTTVGQIMFNPYTTKKVSIINKTSLTNSTPNINSSSSSATTTLRHSASFSSNSVHKGMSSLRLLTSSSSGASAAMTANNIQATQPWRALNSRHNGVNLYVQPPDATVAVGPNHVIEVTNNVIGIWDKNGNLIKIKPLDEFFGTTSMAHVGGDFVTDPVALYDSSSGHWFLAILHAGGVKVVKNDGQEGLTHDCSIHNGCSIDVAVSPTNDPTTGGPWYGVYHFSWGRDFPDYPKIATSDNKFVISVNNFAGDNTNTLPKAQILVADKISMIRGSDNVLTTKFAAMDNEFTVLPAQSLSSTDCLYMVSVFARVVPVADNNKVSLSSTCGNPASPDLTFNRNFANIPMMTVSHPPGNAPQPSGKSFRLTGAASGSILTAVYYNGKIWDGFNDLCTRSSQVCVHIQEIDVKKKTMLYDKIINPSVPSVGIYYPALSVTTDGKAVFAFGASSPSMAPSIFVGYLQNNSFAIGKLIDGSNSIDESRYGDYSGAALDPDGKSVWIALEYGNGVEEGGIRSWSTSIARISVR